MDGSTAYQYGYGKGGKRVKTGKKTMAGIVRKLERTGHKVTDLSKQGVKSIGFLCPMDSTTKSKGSYAGLEDEGRPALWKFSAADIERMRNLAGDRYQR